MRCWLQDGDDSRRKVVLTTEAMDVFYGNKRGKLKEINNVCNRSSASKYKELSLLDSGLKEVLGGELYCRF